MTTPLESVTESAEVESEDISPTKRAFKHVTNFLLLNKLPNVDPSVASVLCDRNGKISATQKETSVIYDNKTHDTSLAVSDV